MVQELSAGHHTDKSDEEEDEDIDELVYGDEDNASQSGSDDDNELQAWKVVWWISPPAAWIWAVNDRSVYGIESVEHVS